MTDKEQLEAKIREAVPNGSTRTCICGRGLDPDELKRINLQDVLIALPQDYSINAETGCVMQTKFEERNDSGGYREWYGSKPLKIWYDLTKDFHSQSNDFYKFLSSIL